MGAALTCAAQDIERDVVSSSGDYYSNSSAQLSVSIGEIVTETTTSSNNVLTQGFQQTNLHNLQRQCGHLDYTLHQ